MDPFPIFGAWLRSVRLHAEARARIAAAQKKRWANQKRVAKKEATS